MAEERPKLVVGIVVDQMRWDYLERFADRFGEGGFRRMLTDFLIQTVVIKLHDIIDGIAEKLFS